MRKFLIRLLFFIVPILFILYFFPKIYYLNKGIDKKITGKFNDLYPLVKNTKSIVIAGDSRAERQLDPLILEKETGIKTINIAVSSGELISFIPYLKHFNPDSTIFIFSTSSWQINDGAVSFGYLSLDSYVKLNIFQRIFIYYKNLTNLVKNEDQLIRSTFKDLYRDIMNINKEYHYENDIIKNKGFLKINKFIFSKEIKKKIRTITNDDLNHPWYLDLKYNSYRNKLFLSAIDKLGFSKFKILIYQPPVTEKFYIENKFKNIGKFEIKFSKILSNYSKIHKNIEFIDFYNTPLRSLNDSCFYDPQHLNYLGAIRFSNYVAKIINMNFKYD